MRLVLLTDTYLPQPGPLARLAHEAAKAFVAADQDVYVVTTAGEKSERVDLVPVSRCAPRDVANHVEQLKPDLVHVFQDGPFTEQLVKVNARSLVAPPPMAVDTEFFRNGDRKAARRRWKLPADASEVIVLVDPESDDAAAPGGEWDAHTHFVTTNDLNVRTPLHAKSLYQAANLCLLTGNYPGSRVVELEAMASGLPVVSDVEAVRELVTERDRRRELGRAARVTAQTQWTWPLAIERVLQTYTTLA